MIHPYENPKPSDMCENEDCEHARHAHDVDADFIDGFFVPLTPCLVDGCECGGFL